jgi:restriction endonuclease
MKLKFDATLEYQHDAINAVVDLFEGMPARQSAFELSSAFRPKFQSEPQA